MMEELLKRLRLPRIRAVYPEYVERANREDMGYEEFLLMLLEEEAANRDENRLKTLMRRARFPYQKTLEQFDFRIHPELRRKMFHSYLEETFVLEGRSLVLIGAPGLGKTHLCISIGIKMVQRGFDVRFVTVQNLVNRVMEGETVREKQRIIRPYLNCDLLVLDEMGYLPPDPEVGPVLYELISSRYEKKATIITSNKSLTEWGIILGDTALAGALIDRLLYHGDVYYLKGESYRLKDKPNSSGSTERDEKEVSEAAGRQAEVIEAICLLAQSGSAFLPQKTTLCGSSKKDKCTLGNFRPDFVNKTGDFLTGFYICARFCVHC